MIILIAIKEQLLNPAILNLKVAVNVVIIADVFVFTYLVYSHLFRNSFEKQNS
jgi:hypothetical protein